ncbi:MAG TPA: hypothetical protein VN711_02645, partial [Candidatus Saccharimonadales bacterium]|nr:hypothetical protein [Candidatus Saccharimonadales bacterium]
MRWRYITILIIFLFAFATIIGKLFYWQVVQADMLSQLGKSQYGQVVNLQPKRGDIETSDGFPLATTALSYLVFANPKEITNVDAVATQLAPLLSIDSATISAKLQTNSYWVSLKDFVPSQTKDEVEKLNIPGVGFQEDYSRLYPEASMAAQLLGFVGKDANGDDKGYFGLEGYYDRQLMGRAGQAVQIHDALGRPILSQLSGVQQTQDGRTLVLHVDRAVQYLVENILKENVDKFEATSGMVGIMDPKTGAI